MIDLTIGFVYFAYCPDLYKKGIQYIKIGHTKNLEKRLGQLQTGNPFKLVFYKTHKSIHYKKIENDLHHKYKSKKILNEWFKMTLKEVDNEINLLNPTDHKLWSTLISEKFVFIWNYFKYKNIKI